MITYIKQASIRLSYFLPQEFCYIAH